MQYLFRIKFTYINIGSEKNIKNNSGIKLENKFLCESVRGKRILKLLMHDLEDVWEFKENHFWFVEILFCSL
jgi:hypothetical protein